MKKILIFSIAYYPHHVSGAEAAVKEITDRISDIEFHMITLRFQKEDLQEEKIGNVHAYRVGNGSYVGKMLFPLLAALKARSLQKKHQFDALWALMTYMLLPTVLAKMFGVRAPYILTLQDGDPYKKVFGRLRIVPFLPLIDKGFREAKIIQVISQYLAKWPRRRGYKGDIVLVHNGANPKNLSDDYPKEEAKALAKELGKKEGDIFLLNAARLVHQKGHDTVIRALALLPDNVKFLLIGGGEDEEMLRALAKEKGVESRVVFVGQLSRDEVPKYRNKTVADIFVGPSRSEGLGNSFLSAMAARLPVITTQEGGLAEFVFDEKRNPEKPTTAWAVDKDSPEQIAEAVKDILANSQKVEKVTARAREMVMKEYNWDVIAKEMREKVFFKVS